MDINNLNYRIYLFSSIYVITLFIKALSAFILIVDTVISVVVFALLGLAPA
jgi:hypothetical protein